MPALRAELRHGKGAICWWLQEFPFYAEAVNDVGKRASLEAVTKDDDDFETFESLLSRLWGITDPEDVELCRRFALGEPLEVDGEPEADEFGPELRAWLTSERGLAESPAEFEDALFETWGIEDPELVAACRGFALFHDPQKDDDYFRPSARKVT